MGQNTLKWGFWLEAHTSGSINRTPWVEALSLQSTQTEIQVETWNFVSLFLSLKAFIHNS